MDQCVNLPFLVAKSEEGSVLAPSGADALDRLSAAVLKWWRTRQECASSAHRLAEQADLLLHRMAALGLDADAVARAQPVTFGDLQRLCATCGWHELCRWDLRHDPIDVASRKYCPNSAVLTALAPMASSLNEWRAPLTLF
jgi:hypothetical protein